MGVSKAEAKRRQSITRAKNDKAKAKQDSIISNSKQSRSDNRGYNSSNSGGKHDDGKGHSNNSPNNKPKTIQERNWADVASPNSTMKQQQRTKEQQASQQLQRGTGGGNQSRGVQTVNPNGSINVRNAREQQKIDKIERRTKQIQDYVEEQEREKHLASQRLEQAKKEQQQYSEYVASPQGRADATRYWNGLSRSQKRSRTRVSPQQRQKNILAQKIASEQGNMKRYDQTITYFKQENKNLKQEISQASSGSFSTSDDSQKTRTSLPPAPATATLSGRVVAIQNYQSIRDFIGLDKQESKPRQTQTVIRPTQNQPANINQFIKSQKPQEKQTMAERFTPTHFEKGSTSFTKAKFGNNKDYISTSNDVKRQDKVVTLPSGEKITMPNTQAKEGTRDYELERFNKGQLSVPENFYQLGKEGIEHTANDIKTGKANSLGNPTELKKDIIMTPLNAVTQEIVPSAEKIARGDLSGVTDYVDKTGKHLNEFGQDVQRDPKYYAGNIQSNVLLIGATLGFGGAVQGAKGVATGLYRNNVVAPKAKSIIEFAHRPKEVTTIQTKKTNNSPDNFGYEQVKTKKPETETIAEIKASNKKQTDDFGNVSQATEKTGKKRTQEVSPIETFEQVADNNGYATYRGTFKKQDSQGNPINNQYDFVEVTMTPNPVMKYFGKPQKNSILDNQPTSKPTQLTKEAGERLQSNIKKVPSFSKEFYQQEVKAGNVKLSDKKPTTSQDSLATLGDENRNTYTFGKDTFTNKKTGKTEQVDQFTEVALSKGEIGKTRQASQAEIQAQASQGKELATVDSFYFDDLANRINYNKQYANQLAEGKIKAPNYERANENYIPKETLSLDSQYFSSNYLSGESSITTALSTGLEPKGLPKGTPSHFEKMTPYEKEFFNQGGAEYKAPNNKAKPFGDSKGNTKKLDDDASPLEMLTKEKQDEVLADLKGAGDFTKATESKPSIANAGLVQEQSQSYQTSNQESFGYSTVEPLGKTINDAPQKQDNNFGLEIESFKAFESTKSKEKLETTPAFALDIIPNFDQGQPTDLKTNQKVTPIISQIIDDKTRPPTTTTLTDVVPEIPLIPEVIPDDPTVPTTTRTPVATPFPTDFEDPFSDELLWGSKKNKGKKRYHNVDPTKVLGHFKSGSLGYQSTEYKELTKGKKKSKKSSDYSFNDMFDDFKF